MKSTRLPLTNASTSKTASFLVTFLLSLAVVAVPVSALQTDPLPTDSALVDPTTADPRVNPASQLAALVIADPEPNRPAYIRSEYQPGGWSDFDNDCISTRHEVLETESLEPVTLTTSGCSVDTGLWIDPLTGEAYATASAITIDHHVPLANAHRSGAWRWDQPTKELFANDETPGHLVPVGPEVNQSKADQSPDQWLPPLQSAHCGYAEDWIDVKFRWELEVTQAEHDELLQIINSCATAPLPDPVPADDCHPAYVSPCLPIGPDLDCKDVQQQVILVDPRDDPYRLDSVGVGDGIGCRSYPPS